MHIFVTYYDPVVGDTDTDVRKGLSALKYCFKFLHSTCLCYKISGCALHSGILLLGFRKYINKLRLICPSAE
jgi:hypothetical protein